MKVNPIIIDYGVGNLYSLRKAIEFLGIKPIVSCDPNEITKATHLFLPGVGSFFKATETLKKLNLFSLLKNLDYKNYKLMGICLGMQMLFDSSTEDQFTNGLSLINGKIEKIDIKNQKDKKFKIPNIGWFNLKKNKINQNEDLFRGTNFLQDKFYFVHSYYASKVKDDVLKAFIKYDNLEIPAVVKQGNIIGTQFHPEKSRSQGINLIKNFLT